MLIVDIPFVGNIFSNTNVVFKDALCVENNNQSIKPLSWECKPASFKEYKRWHSSWSWTTAMSALSCCCFCIRLCNDDFQWFGCPLSWCVGWNTIPCSGSNAQVGFCPSAISAENESSLKSTPSEMDHDVWNPFWIFWMVQIPSEVARWKWIVQKWGHGSRLSKYPQRVAPWPERIEVAGHWWFWFCGPDWWGSKVVHDGSVMV